MLIRNIYYKIIQNNGIILLDAIELRGGEFEVRMSSA